jgi:F-type H+-transporting ATPase subunit delta
MSEAANGEVSAGAARIARTYAEALLAEAEKRNAAEEVLEELRALREEVAGKDPLIASFFLGGVVGRDRRADALRKSFEGRVSDLFLNFLLVLNNHDRLELLRPVETSFRSLLEQRQGKVRVSVASAVPLPDDQREVLVSRLRKLLDKEPVLDESVDPDLLGGLVVQVGDFRFDGSVRTQLESLRHQLIERSSHEIQAGRDRFSSAE